MKRQIVAEALTRDFIVDGIPVNAVKDASFAINRGEFVSIIGHSGSGKTTLLSMVGTIIRPTSGRILYEGLDLSSLDNDALSLHRSSKIGFIFQFSSLLNALTAQENVLLPLIFNKEAADKRDAERAVHLLESVGMADKLNAYPWQLSGGQQRRVAIARAFINSPELILADEPTGDLDEETESEIMSLFGEVNKRDSVTFLLVTHNTQLAGRAARRFSMNRGIISELP